VWLPVTTDRGRPALTVLHLADLQFGAHHRFGSSGLTPADARYDTLASRLLDDLAMLRQRYDIAPDLVVVAGDLAERAMPAEYEVAYEFLTTLREGLRLDTDRIVLVPGNHDVNRSWAQAYFLECEANDEDPRRPYSPKWTSFATLFHRLTGQFFSPNEPWSYLEIPELKVAVAGLNSTMADSHRDEDHYGWLGEKQLRYFAERMRQAADRGWLRLGVVHHSPTRGLVSDDAHLRDTDRFTDVLAPWLHLVFQATSQEMSAVSFLGPGAVPVFSAGNAQYGGERTTSVSSQYRLVAVHPDRMVLFGRRFDAARRRWVGDSGVSETGDDWRRSIRSRFADWTARGQPRALTSSMRSVPLPASARGEDDADLPDRSGVAGVDSAPGEERLLRLAEASGNPVRLAETLYQLGTMAYERGDVGLAVSRFQRLLSVAEEADDQPQVAAAWYRLGTIADDRGEVNAADKAYRRALRAAEQGDDQLRILAVLDRFGQAAAKRGDLASALGYYRRSLAVAEEVGDRRAATGIRRRIAEISDETNDLPHAVQLPDLPAAAVGGLEPASIMCRWRRGGGGLGVRIGSAAGGPLTIDLVRDGPHALIVGIDDDGRRDLVRSLVAALALAHPPDRWACSVAYCGDDAGLVGLRHLPHLLELTSRFDAYLAQRTLAFLTAEIRRREQAFTAADVAGLDQYDVARTHDATLPPLYRLVLLFDQFDAIAESAPSLAADLLTAAEHGQATGLHLVLAMRRVPAPLAEQLRQLPGVRLALRVDEPGDSLALLGTEDAAYLPSVPGRGYARPTSELLIPFQSAQITDQQLAALGQTMHVAGRELDVAPARPFLRAQLPARLGLTEATNLAPPPPAESQPIGYGLADFPSEPGYRLATLDLAACGHLLVVGDPGSGRSQLLRTIAGAAALAYRSAELHLYGIDCGGGALQALRDLPNCGAVVTDDETTRATRLLERLTTELRQRQQLLAEGGFATLAEQRRAESSRPLPHIVVLVDGAERLADTVGRAVTVGGAGRGRPVEQLTDLLSEGGWVGIHLVLAGDRQLVDQPYWKLAAERLVLPLADRDAVTVPGIALASARIPGEWSPGRALHPDGDVQIAILGAEPDPASQAAALAAIAAATRSRDFSVPNTERPFPVEAASEAADRFHVGDAHGHPVGREEVFAWLLDRHASRTSVVLRGPRRAGKSWIKDELAARLRTRGATNVHSLSLSPPEGRVDRADDIAVLLGSDSPYGTTHDMSPARALRDQARRCRDTTDPLVFLLDEVGRLMLYNPVAVSWLRDLSQAGAWLVYFGTEKDWRSAVRWALEAPGSSFGNDVNTYELGPWPERTAMTFLQGTAANLGVDIPSGTGEEILKAVGTWPYYLQVVGDALVQARRRNELAPLSDHGALRRLIEDRLIDGCTDVFEGRWKEIGAAGRSALRDASDASQELPAEPGVGPDRLTPAQRDDLRTVGLLRPGDTWLDDRPFFTWIRRNATLLRDRATLDRTQESRDR
jgi:S-DNA-T family DNA segregation ATPase FtsK/SpoIIIE